MTGVRARANVSYRIEPLATHHARSHFACGQPALDRYLRERARQDVARHSAAVFVAVPFNEPHIIAGYYTLSSLTVDASALPVAAARKLPRYPQLPATLLGRLAVTQHHQGCGLGEYLLIDALRRSLDATTSVGSVAVVVDPLDDRARTFYEKYQFIALADKPSRLFLPMGTIQRGLT